MSGRGILESVCGFTESALYSSIRIQGYRSLDSFRMQGLGRVNLLVGTNNCGKTSILECIELLRSVGDQHVLSSIAGRRGEWAYTSNGDARGTLRARANPLEVSHLFANHELGRRIQIEADRVGDVDPVAWNDKVSVYVAARSASEHDGRDEEPEDDDQDARLVLHVKWSDATDDYTAFVTDDGLLPSSQLRRAIHLGRALRLGRWKNLSSQAVQFVRTSGVTAADVVETFNQFVLTPKEQTITQALRIIEPAIERMALDLRDRHSRDAPGGVALKLRDIPVRVPIGSTGDGTWRMLGLALSIANAEGGVLLVDEIDTGLHYSVMEAMWRMITKQAAALSVQVFATTHSRDCYESLAPIAQSDEGDVTIQRIDRSRNEAVRFSRDAIVAAAERGIEVR